MVFKLTRCADDAPMVNDPFFAWLDKNNPRDSGDREALVHYLESVGFRLGVDRLSEADLKHLRYVRDHWHAITPHSAPMTLAAAFSGTTGPDFFVDGLSGRGKPSKKLLQVLKASGWIYEPSPDNVYFSIINGNLFARGQQILASRFLCRIEGI